MDKKTLPRVKKMTDKEREEQFVKDRAAIRGISVQQYRDEARKFHETQSIYPHSPTSSGTTK